MIDAQLLYTATGALVFVLGLRGALLHPAFLGRVIGFNVSGVGLFLALIALAYRGPQDADPVPQALVLTGIVVAVSATAFALALARRIEEAEDE